MNIESLNEYIKRLKDVDEVEVAYYKDNTVICESMDINKFPDILVSYFNSIYQQLKTEKENNIYKNIEIAQNNGLRHNIVFVGGYNEFIVEVY